MEPLGSRNPPRCHGTETIVGAPREENVLRLRVRFRCFYATNALMLSNSSKSVVGEPADSLTQILRELRLDGVEYNRCDMRSPWAVAFPAQDAARFHFVTAAACWLKAGQDWHRLDAGDAVLLPRGSAHVMASAPDVEPVEIGGMTRQLLSNETYLVSTASPPGGVEPGQPTHRLFCGSMRFNLDPLHPLMAMMPEVMRTEDLAQSETAVPALLAAMQHEIALDRIGASGILTRLADVLAGLIIRAWVECGCSDAGGWVAAVRCPKIGKVLAAIHTNPERDWSVDELAAIMGASRSSFADKFVRTVGESPARYVARVNMLQARKLIADEGLRLSVVANRLGYESEASFSRAFKRVIGHPPSSARAIE